MFRPLDLMGKAAHNLNLHVGTLSYYAILTVIFSKCFLFLYEKDSLVDFRFGCVTYKLIITTSATAVFVRSAPAIQREARLYIGAKGQISTI